MAKQDNPLPIAAVSALWLLAIVLFTSGLPTAKAQSYETGLKERLATVDQVTSHGDFRPDWASLGHYRVPDWYRDAKFGIFIHWGVFSVPAFANEWYPRNMYQPGDPAFRHHVETYGPQSKFGYKDFIPMFTATRFDPNAWVELFQRAGAKYIVPVAEHCDGFPMYASDFTQWNAARMGPKRDVIGEIAQAARAHGLHFGLSSHRAEHWWFYSGGRRFDSDVNDPRNAGLYGPAQRMALPGDPSEEEPDPSHLERWLPPDQPFLDDWLARSTELVDKYQPELFYFDWWIGQPAFVPYRQRMAAYYYDRAAAWGKGVVLTAKDFDFPENAAVLDVERGKLDGLRLLPWQSDTSVSVKSWGYVEHDTYRTPKSLIAELVDVVSKNGNFLLNVGPKSDGTIPDEVREVLLAMGQWLSVNGEAIFGSRPWMVYGEGPTSDAASHTMGNDAQSYSAQDIRFTTKGDTVYAIALGWPEDGKLTIHTLWEGTPYLSAITQIELLGSTAKLRWQQSKEGLTISLPPTKPNDTAYVFRISGTGAAGTAKTN
jgi:alpha-L-fucosidase